MGAGKYTFLLLLTFINSVLLIIGNSFISQTYLNEFLFIIVSLIIAIILMINLFIKNTGYGYFTFYFIFNLVNFLIMYITKGSSIFIGGVIVNMAGSVFSVYNVGKRIATKIAGPGMKKEEKERLKQFFGTAPASPAYSADTPAPTTKNQSNADEDEEELNKKRENIWGWAGAEISKDLGTDGIKRTDTETAAKRRGRKRDVKNIMNEFT